MDKKLGSIELGDEQFLGERLMGKLLKSCKPGDSKRRSKYHIAGTVRGISNVKHTGGWLPAINDAGISAVRNFSHARDYQGNPEVTVEKR